MERRREDEPELADERERLEQGHRELERALAAAHELERTWLEKLTELRQATTAFNATVRMVAQERERLREM